jgi:hypothetical protein
MLITKRALLISNPGEVGAENYCKGVYVDINNYQRLLFSAQGGAWETNEITNLDRPSLADVRAWIANMSAVDYVFVMFTGHGWFSELDHDRVLELRSGQSIASNELLKGTKRRTLVLDCCQKVYKKTLIEKHAHVFSGSIEPERRPLNREACKKLFSDLVSVADEGFLRLSSCSIGEYSYDDDKEGAHYNSSLIRTVENWANGAAARYSQAPISLSVVAAHEQAATLTTKRSGGLQHPVIEKPKSMPYFPIAVFA